MDDMEEFKVGEEGKKFSTADGFKMSIVQEDAEEFTPKCKDK